MIFNIFTFLFVLFAFTLVVGKVIEKIKVPWIFAALIFGALLAVYNPFKEVTSSESFSFLSSLGIYFLLFIIGLEIDIKEFRKKGGFLVRSTFFIILFEAAIGTGLVYFLFGYPLVTSALVALSFATVGEAILIPILDEFKAINTPLGQTLIGIGTLDDIIEVFALIMVSFLIGNATNSSIATILISLGALVLLLLGLTKVKEKPSRFKHFGIEELFLISMLSLFLFLGVAKTADAAPLGAFFAGITLKNIIPHSRLALIEKEIRSITYGLFAPIFFASVGLELDLKYLITFPLLVVVVSLVASLAKVVSSYIAAHRKLGLKKSILLGIGLSIRFSTSIIIIKILFNNGIIGKDLYSVIVASSIAFKFIVPVLFANLLVRWNDKVKINIQNAD